MSVKYTDSTNKIFGYLKNAQKTVVLSKLFFRDYTCPESCGGCCPKFSLDFFEGERWEIFKKEYPDKVAFFKKREIAGVNVYSYLQDDNETRWCRFLDLSIGRCSIHKSNPFSCEFELIKFITRGENQSILIKKLFGRGWNLLTVTGKRGGVCKMTAFNFQKLKRDIELLKELNEIGNKFQMTTKLPKIIKFLESNLSKFEKNYIPSKNIVF